MTQGVACFLVKHLKVMGFFGNTLLLPCLICIFCFRVFLLVRSSEPMFRQQYQYWKMYSENFFCNYLEACTRTRFWSVNICGFHLAKNLSYIQNTLQNFKMKCTRDSDVSTTLVNQELCTCHPRWLSILLFWV